ncbi:trafficking regulator of GLUT4 1-like [Pleurodeles waltl]
MEQSQRSYPSYLALSIFNMLCCCFPLGVVALVCSLRVENAAGIGDTERASKASRTSRILNIVGIVLGVVFLILVIVLYVTVGKHQQ